MPFVLNSTVILSGAGTYTPPAGVTALWIRMVGGGGGGGGASSGLAVNARGAGGGGGGYLEKFLTPLAASYSYSVGTGGTGGPDSANNGTAGNDTTFGALTAKGGNGGLSSSVTADGGNAGAAGGVAGTGGDLIAQGFDGLFSYKNSGRLEGAKGAGSAFGAGGRAVYANAAGNPGLGFGAGGGGSISQNNSQAGGNGANGTIIVFEFKDSSSPPVPPVIQNPSLSIGTVVTLTANQIYALPPRAVVIYFQGTTPDQSNDGLTWAAISNSAILSSGFIRSTGSDTIVKLAPRLTL